MEETKVAEELKSVNLNDVNLPDEEIEIDSSEDAFSFGAPPPDKVWLVKLILGQEGPKGGKNASGQHDYVIPIEARIMEEGDYKDAVMFYNASTRMQRGKKICTMAAIIHELGFKVDAKTSKLKLAKGLLGILKQEKTCYVESEWQAFDKNEGKNGRTLCKGMDAFPKTEDNKPIPEIKNVRTGEIIPARAKIVRFLSAKAAKQQSQAAKAKPKTTVAAAAAATTNSSSDEILELEQE